MTIAPPLGQKRMRSEDEAIVGVPHSASSSASAASSFVPGRLVPGRTEPRFPRVWEVGTDGRQQLTAACGFGFCEEAPSLPRAISTHFFDDATALVLRQILTGALKRHATILASTRKWLIGAGRSNEDVEEELSRMSLVMHDCGAGTGAVTDFLLRTVAELAPAEGLRVSSDPPAVSGPGEGAGVGVTNSVDTEVYAQDCWDVCREYYASQLAAYGHDALSSSWAASQPRPPHGPFTQFCANFWADPRVIPARFPMALGVQQLAHMGVAPALSYLHADLSSSALSATLEAMWSKWMDPAVIGTPQGPRVPTFVAGGGWDLSDGVRTAVLHFAAERGLSVHVEQGKCWTLCRDLIKETRNDASAAAALVAAADAAADPSVTQALRVEEEGALRAGALGVWQSSLFALLESGSSDLVALCQAIGPHGGRGKGGGEVGGSGEGAWSHEAWIDEGGEDKLHLTPLMRACKSPGSPLPIITALIDAHGAGVNVQAKRSLSSALHVAAYAGREEVVGLLLERGADPRLLNKFAETPATAAGGRKGGPRLSIERVAAVLAAAEVKWRERG